MVVNYDLQQQLVSFDFYSWLVEWANRGATEVVFKTDQFRPGVIYSDEVMRHRFESIILPGPAFMGLPCREGLDGEKVGPSTKTGNLVHFAREFKTFRRFRTVKPASSARYTVTIRESRKSPWRNSNKTAWLTFAADIGATVIDDYEVKPIHVHDLMALYAGAEMNFGVNGGPLGLCSMSEYPCMYFKLDIMRAFMEKSGVAFGEPMPWHLPNQFGFWESDCLDNIRRRFDEWRARSI